MMSCVVNGTQHLGMKRRLFLVQKTEERRECFFGMMIHDKSGIAWGLTNVAADGLAFDRGGIVNWVGGFQGLTKVANGSDFRGINDIKSILSVRSSDGAD